MGVDEVKEMNSSKRLNIMNFSILRCVNASSKLVTCLALSGRLLPPSEG